jgi:hypothetical protein
VLGGGKAETVVRFDDYADGHGGNKAMRELAHPPDEYDVRILETAGSAASPDDVYDLESLWKDKLGSRAQGLNRNQGFMGPSRLTSGEARTTGLSFLSRG